MRCDYGPAADTDELYRDAKLTAHALLAAYGDRAESVARGMVETAPCSDPLVAVAVGIMVTNAIIELRHAGASGNGRAQ